MNENQKNSEKLITFNPEDFAINLPENSGARL
jgi:hypothetical protein